MSLWQRFKAWLRNYFYWGAALLLLLLAGCSAGGGTTTITATAPPPPPPPTTTVPPPPPNNTWLPGTPPGGGVHCGTERWAVKTLSDGTENNIDFNPLNSTVTQLGALPVPANTDGPTRVPEELKTYTVLAHLDFVKTEADNDYHLGLSDNGQTMIAEIPSPACDGVTNSPFYSELANVRDTFQPCVGAEVRVSGVLFFDRIHGQSDVAPNGVELHPVTSITCGASTLGKAEAKGAP